MKTNTYYKSVIILLGIIISLNINAQSVDSVFYYNESGQQEWWYIQKDVYAFRTINGLPYTGTDANMSVVDQKYHEPNTPRKLNIMEFKPTSTDPQKVTEKNKVRIKPTFECEFPVITKEKTLDKSFNKWKTVDDYILIVFRDSYISSSDVSQFAIRNDLILVHQPSNALPQDYSWTYIFRLGPTRCGSSDPITVAKEIYVNESAIVKISEPNIRTFTSDVCMTVNEMSLDAARPNKLWHIENTGLPVWLTFSGTIDADADICECWGDGYNGNGIKVADIDYYGFEFTHEDMLGKFQNGWNCISDIPLTTTTIVDPTKGHGMMVSGIIAANANNNIGVAGAAFGSTVIPYLISGSPSEVIIALQKALPDGADVINMSFSSTVDDNAVHNEIINLVNTGRPNPWDPTIKNGTVLIGSAGNSINSATPFYPAAYPEVIGVGASNPDDYRGTQGDGWGWATGSGSNYGPFYEVVAPGTKITSLDYMGSSGYTSGNYDTRQGTSFSAPIVSSIAAILLSKNYTLTWSQVRSAIINNAEKVRPSTYNYNYNMSDPGRSFEMQYGRVSCIATLQSVVAGINDVTSPPIDINVFNSSGNELTIYYNLNGKEKQISLIIYDALGRQVSSTILQGEYHEAKINTDKFGTGIYFIGFYSGRNGLIKSHKFFKQ